MATSDSAPTADRSWLLAVDGSEPANAAARYVARWAGALGVRKVCVLTAEPIESYRAYALRREEVEADAAERGAKAAAEALRILDAANVRYRFEAKLGEVADTIATEARRCSASEIVMGTQGLSQLPGMLLGSVAYKMIHAADMPVTLVPPPRDGGPAVDASGVHRILLAFDGSEAARRATRYVGAFAEASAEIDVLLAHVEHPMRGDDAPPASEPAAPGSTPDLEAAAATLAGPGVRCRPIRARGPLAQTLVQLAVNERCTRIVMGKRGLGTMQSLIVGSLAHAVSHLSPLPVTLVH